MYYYQYLQLQYYQIVGIHENPREKKSCYNDL